MADEAKKARAPKNTGTLMFEFKNQDGAWIHLSTPTFEDTTAAKTWLRGNAKAGQEYRLIREIQRFTPSVETVQKIKL